MSTLSQSFVAQSSPRVSRLSSWLRGVVVRPRITIPTKPAWVNLPDRVWRRNSALILSLHEDRSDKPLS